MKLSSLWLSLAPISCALHCLCLCCFKICFPVCFATLSGKVVWWGVSGTLYWAVQRQQLCRLGWVLSWALLKPCLACTVLPWHDFFFFLIPPFSFPRCLYHCFWHAVYALCGAKLWTKLGFVDSVMSVCYWQCPPRGHFRMHGVLELVWSLW